MSGVGRDGASPFNLLTLLRELHRPITHGRTTGPTPTPIIVSLFQQLYLVPGHLRLLVWSQIVLDVRAGDHFAVGNLRLLQMADFAAEAFALVALLHRHRHGHFHAVCGIPEQKQKTKEKFY